MTSLQTDYKSLQPGHTFNNWQAYKWSPYRIAWLWAHSGIPTRRAFASAVGISDRSVARWLSGQFAPTPAAKTLLGQFADRYELTASMERLPDDGSSVWEVEGLTHVAE